MDERFTYLVVKFLEHDLEGAEILEFENYLTNPECDEYLKKEEFANKIIEEGFRNILSDAEKKAILETGPDETPAEIIEDFKNYTGKNEETFRAELKKAERRMMNHRKIMRLLGYGAAVVAVIIGLVFLFTADFSSSSRKIFKQYYKPYEYIDIQSTSGDHAQYNSAIMAYKSGNYSNSAGICRELTSKGSGVPGYRFLYGLCYMGMDSIENALQQFKKVEESPDYKDIGLYIPVHWYASLCYLSMGKEDSALNELDKLEGMENGPLKEYKVKELQSDLKRLSR